MFHYAVIFISVVVCSSYCQGYQYEVKYLDVKLDHFTYVSNQTFKLKYLVNAESWDQEGHGPIYFYTGNEGRIESFANNLGFILESAKRLKALVVFAEHRYYGDSKPFGNKSLSTPATSGYLTIEQALADFVDVIQHLQDESKVKLGSNYKKGHPVIGFGGSYGGMLAYWLRYKYPHMVQGVLASSAPMRQFLDNTSDLPCDLFYEATTKIYRDESVDCEANVKRSWSELNDFLKTDQGRVVFSKEWNLCAPIRTQYDVGTFRNWLTDMYTTMAMVNYPYEFNYLTPLPGNPVQKFCNPLRSSLNGTSLLSALREATHVYTDPMESSCLNWTESPIAIPAWHYQTCTELLFPFCGGDKTMFEPTFSWDLESYSQSCEQQFGVRPEIEKTNKLFGTDRFDLTTNVIFSNGLKDPWGPGGIQSPVSESVQVISLADSAHHLDLGPANPADPPSVVEARKMYEETFRKWINEFNMDH